MTAIPLARYLLDIHPAETIAANADAASRMKEAARQREASVAATSASLEQGREQGRNAAAAEWEGKLAEQKRESENRLAAERRAWIAEEGDLIAERLCAALRGVETRIAETLARTLKPFLGEQLRQKAVAEFAAAVEAAVSGGEFTSVQVSGPEDLLERVQQALAGRVEQTQFVANDSCDVRAVIDQTVLETRLGEWLAKIEEAAR